MRRKLLIGAVLVAVVAAAASSYAWAAGGAVATQTLNACVDRDGQLRLVALAGDCKKAETPLSWNTIGPAGSPGTPGAQGIAGRDGLTGPQGPAGASASAASDPNAVAGTMVATGQKQGALGSITLTGISHEIVSPRDPASGLPTGKRQHKPFTITKEIDKATPLLMRALVENENLTSVLIGLLRNGQQVATVKLTNANVSNYIAHGLTETWSMTYQKITWTWVDGGITAEDDWLAPVAR
jgi:type VI secretion system secreted protein Hcp